MRRLIEFSNDLLDANLDELSLLGSAIAKRDSDTDAHNYRVTLYSVRLAEAIKLDETLMHSLIKGSFLHDVRKIGIRDDILLKQGSLDEEQFSIMKTHVMHGSDIIKQSAWLKDSLSIVACHHEKFDGSGYPSGLKGDEISLEESLKIMEKGRGSHFDPKLLDAFQTIAPGLYTNIKNREIEDLRQELDALVHTYFSSSMATLQY